MKFRLFACLFMGLTLVATPALAKKKAPVAATPATNYPTVIDMDPTHDAQNVLFLDLSTGGRVTIRLMPAWAPRHVERIKALVAEHFYDGLIFHRVIDGFMAQTGDPGGTGEGGSKLPDLKAEFNPMPHVRGSVSMARTNDPDSANSQFFIVFYPRFALDKKYTVFGRVIAGMDVVDQIQRGEPPTNPTKILRASLASEGLPPPAIPAPVPVTVPDPAPVAGAPVPAKAPARRSARPSARAPARTPAPAQGQPRPAPPLPGMTPSN